jgi:MATE family multidrug resistance protein
MFIGATRGAEMRNSMAVAAAGFGLTLLTLPWLGNHGLWLALAVFSRCEGYRWLLSGTATGKTIPGFHRVTIYRDG